MLVAQILELHHAGRDSSGVLGVAVVLLGQVLVTSTGGLLRRRGSVSLGFSTSFLALDSAFFAPFSDVGASPTAGGVAELAAWAGLTEGSYIVMFVSDGKEKSLGGCI